MIVLLLLLLEIGLLTEIFSIHLFFQNFLQMAFIAHIISSFFISFSVLLFLIKYYKHEIWIAFIFTLLLSFFLPMAGLIIILFVVISVFSTHTKFHLHAELLDDSINLNNIHLIHPQYGAGGASMKLLNKLAPTSERTKALFFMAQSHLGKINNLMYQLLSDESYEIRLLAFNILDQQESSISDEINKLLTTLKNTPDLTQETIARIEKNLAMLYWEFIDRKLLLSELNSSAIKKSEQYALSASQVLNNDASLWSLLGKIYLHLKQYDPAIKAFLKTMELNIPSSLVLPYLAEIQFHLQDYIGAQKYLSQSEALGDMNLIAPIRRFWSRQ